MASTTAPTYIFVLISGPGMAMSCKGFLKACSNMSSCVYLQRGQRSHRPCGRLWWNIFSRFIGHYRYATLKCICHSYTFMVAVNLPIKPSSILAAGETAKLLTVATAWRQRGGGCAVFPICQLLDRQQQTVNQSPLRWDQASPCSGQTNSCVFECVFTQRIVRLLYLCHVALTLLSEGSTAAKF